jgi:simple sugar transport system ATP-binding protein
VGNSFTVLNRGRSLGTSTKKNISREKLLSMMAGGEELDKLEVELKEMDRLSNR